MQVPGSYFWLDFYGEHFNLCGRDFDQDTLDFRSLVVRRIDQPPSWTQCTATWRLLKTLYFSQGCQWEVIKKVELHFVVSLCV